jgi:hypothetical protein
MHRPVWCRDITFLAGERDRRSKNHRPHNNHRFLLESCRADVSERRVREIPEKCRSGSTGLRNEPSYGVRVLYVSRKSRGACPLGISSGQWAPSTDLGDRVAASQWDAQAWLIGPVRRRRKVIQERWECQRTPVFPGGGHQGSPGDRLGKSAGRPGSPWCVLGQVAPLFSRRLPGAAGKCGV